MSKTPEYICWFDLETTASNENTRGAFVLEIGYVITDYNLNELDAGSRVANPVLPKSVRMYVDENDIGGNVLPVEEALRSVFNLMDPYVQNMHTVNGLWDDVEASEYDVQDLDVWWSDALSAVGGKGQLTMGGSGVGHFDSRWVRKFLPESAKRFVYSPLDVGNIRRFLKDVAKVDASDADPQGLSAGDAKTHRALDDARAHLAEAKFYRDLFSARL